jgi:uncharacterized membrane protein YqiK
MSPDTTGLLTLFGAIAVCEVVALIVIGFAISRWGHCVPPHQLLVSESGGRTVATSGGYVFVPPLVARSVSLSRRPMIAAEVGTAATADGVPHTLEACAVVVLRSDHTREFAAKILADPGAFTPDAVAATAREHVRALVIERLSGATGEQIHSDLPGFRDSMEYDVKNALRDEGIDVLVFGFDGIRPEPSEVGDD